MWPRQPCAGGLYNSANAVLFSDTGGCHAVVSHDAPATNEALEPASPVPGRRDENRAVW